ncbi:hypothetical protein LWI29_001533 [Acer saccharum]|uniref:Uncharacterized protein n=1 Tax=Acer saccharum TaxID=4024 RepID=A0AA39SJL3_ACESA|nr:hypothetical protein LWI29_001533 [Acer saccharum]
MATSMLSMTVAPTSIPANSPTSNHVIRRKKPLHTSLSSLHKILKTDQWRWFEKLNFTSLREFTRAMEKVGLKMVEMLASAVGFENPIGEDRPGFVLCCGYLKGCMAWMGINQLYWFGWSKRNNWVYTPRVWFRK